MKEMEMTITPLFAAPFMKINLLAEDYNLEALATYANIQMAKDSDGIVKSNVGGWHSKNLDLRDATITRTLRKLGQHINQFIDFYKVDREKYNWEFSESWFITNRKGDYNVSHVHPNSFLSGVFYLKTYEDAGDLVFHHHAKNIDYHKQPKDAFKENVNYNSDYWRVTPEDGDLIVFPSFLTHSVEENKNDFQRMVLSFNINLIKND